MRNDKFIVGLMLFLFLAPIWVPLWVVMLAWDIASDMSAHTKDWVLSNGKRSDGD